MNKDKTNRDKVGNPEKTYREELHNEGSTFKDTNAESAARDKAKIEKAVSGRGQKMDSIDKSELEEMDDEG